MLHFKGSYAKSDWYSRADVRLWCNLNLLQGLPLDWIGYPDVQSSTLSRKTDNCQDASNFTRTVIYLVCVHSFVDDANSGNTYLPSGLLYAFIRREQEDMRWSYSVCVIPLLVSVVTSVLDKNGELALITVSNCAEFLSE